MTNAIHHDSAAPGAGGSAKKPFPPRPGELPFLGSVVGMVRDPLGFLTRLVREHGDVVRFNLAGDPIYLFSHPDVIEEVLKPSDDYLIKDAFTRGLSIVAGRSLLTADGEFWRRQRKLAQPAFHHHRVRAYAGVMVRQAGRFADRLKDGETRDVHEDMMRLTLDIVAETLFGADVGSDAGRIGNGLETLMARFAGIGAFIPPWFPSPGNFRMRRALEELDEIVYGIIHGRRASAVDRGDLLSMLLAATTEEGGKMSDQQLRDEVMTLMLAGHETTALALTYTFHLLSRHPNVLGELSSEVTKVLGDRPATFADIQNLPYADSVVREALRLYPPAWSIGREAVRPCRVAGVDVPQGAQLWLSQWVVHHDARWFPNPDAFEPERWRDDLAKRLPRFAYFPFGGGPRVCIGNAFATMEAVLLLVTIVQRAHFQAEDRRPLRFTPSVTLRPKGPVRMRVERQRATASARSA